MRKIKLIFIAMVALMILIVMPANVFAVSGSGTEGDPYIVISASDFDYVRNNLSAHYKLAANITLSSAWTPIGSSDKPFTGSFDGDGYTLSGLAISQSGGSVYAGLFGFSTGDIRNINLKMAASGISVTSASVVYAGGIVAYNKGGDIENCMVEGTISVSASSTGEMNVYAGMIAGRSSGRISSAVAIGSMTISATENVHVGTAASDACVYAGGVVGLSEIDMDGNTSAVTVNATVTSSTKYVAPKAYTGGIAGANIGKITESQSAGAITAEAIGTMAEASAYAGGIAGFVNGDIKIAKATGNITAKTNADAAKTYAGGIAGFVSGSINETYATGEARAQATTVTDVAYAGGLAGLVNGQISDSYAIGKASVSAANALSGGLVGFTSAAATDSYYKENSDYTVFTGCGTSKTENQLKTESSFENWDFTSTWKISDDINDGYPYLIVLSNVMAIFEDATYTYDGTRKTLEATNIAENVTITYTNNTGINAGVYHAVATLTTEGYNTTQLTAMLTIKPILLRITGITVNDKEFDNTTKATIDVSNAVIEGVIEGDEVFIDAENYVANFITDSVGDNRQVIISEIKLKGEDAANYTAGTYYSEANIYEGDYEHVVFEGSGTQADPYLITDEDELNAIKGNLDAHFKLMNNIELENNWVPIGRKNNPFTGTFNGNNYTISGMKVDPSINYTYSGLFGYSTGNISNLNVVVDDDIYTDAQTAYIGAIAGYNGGTISNCMANGSITTSPLSTFVYVGGIAGTNNGIITYCNSNINITGKGSTVYAGGVAGENNYTIQNTAAAGDISAENALFAYAGGFVGTTSGTVSNCYSRGNVTVTVSDTAFMINVGGFASRVESGTLSYCYSTGRPELTVTAGNYVLQEATGGFAAYNSGMLSNCYYDSTLSGKTDADKGIPKTTDGLKTKTTFSGWNFDIWDMDDLINDGYPYIKTDFTLKENALLEYKNRTVTVSSYADIRNATLIVASYNEGGLVDIDFTETFSVGKGEIETYEVAEDFEEVVGGRVKVMLWKSFDSMMPLCTYKEVPIR